MSWRRLSSRSKLMRHLRFEALEIRNLLSVTPWPLTSLTQPPALFVENQGQWTDAAIRYGCHAVGANIGITDSGMVFALLNPLAPQVELVSLNFAGASGTPAAVGDAVAVFNYFIGPPQAWRISVPAYPEVVYAGLYDGVDLSLVATPTDLLYRFELAPGVESGLIQLEFSGIAGLELGEDGSLRVLVADIPGALVQPAPMFHQVVDSETVEILGRWVLTGEARASFEPVDPYDPTLAIQIVGSWVWWPTFPQIPEDGVEYPEDGEDGLPEEPPMEDGGNDDGDEGEPGNGDVGDEDGNGDAGDQPEVPGENGDSGENGDGGNGDDSENGGDMGEEIGDDEEPGDSEKNAEGNDIGENGDSGDESEVGDEGDSGESGDGGGNGDSGESDGVGESGNGGEIGEPGDAGNGDAGNGDDAGENGENGDTGDSGDTGSGDGENGGNGNGLPEEDNGKDGWLPELPLPPTAFLVKVTPDGNPLGRVGFGWPNINWITETAITPTGQWVNVGFVWAPLALATTREGLVYTGADAFVAKWAGEGPAIWCTFFGGNADDFARAVAVDSAGDIIAAGHTRSHSWFGNSPEVEETDNTDLFVAKLDADGALLWTTAIGGSGDELGLAVVVDDRGDIFVTGQTSSADWVAGGGDTTLDGPTDAYLVKLSSAGIHQWSTFIGGEGDEVGLALAVDEEGYIWVLGLSTSPEWVADGLELPPYYTVQEWMGILFGGQVNNPPTAEVVRVVDILPADVDTSVRVRVADLLIFDDGLGTIQLRLSGPDADLFEVDPAEGEGRRDTFAFRPARGHAYLTSADYQITLLNFDRFDITASDREDRAFLIGGDGDTVFTFRAADGTAEMTTVGRWGVPASADVAGFGLVRAYAGRGGTSVARFYDSPETADHFWGSPKWAALSAGGLYGRADAFGAYEVYFSGGGGGDVSILYDDPLTSDQLVSRLGEAILTYGGRVDRYILSQGHRWLKGYASGFPEVVDEAHVYIPAGSNNQQVRASFPNPQLVLSTDNHYAYMKRFKVVKVYGNVGENAIARVWDSVGDEHLFADGALHPRRAVVTSGEYSIELENLAHVTVVGVEGGDNTREIRNSDLLDFALETVGDWRVV